MTQTTVLITTRLKIRDAVAETAMNCLVNDLGYENVLTNIRRRTLWTITITHEDNEDPMEIARNLAVNTRLFVNPNKHLFHINKQDDLPDPVTRDDDHHYTVHLVISDRDDSRGENTLLSLQSLYSSAGQITHISAGELWMITLKTDSRESAGNIAMDIAISRSQTQGLLANPHSQTVHFLE